MKNKNQTGVILMEIILGLGLLSIIFLILVKYTTNESKELITQNAAHQMERIIDESTIYVKNNYTELYRQAESGTILLDLNDIYPTTSILDFNTAAPFSGEFELIVRIPYDVNSGTSPEETSLQVILYSINIEENVDWVTAQKTARAIKNSQGGVVYTSNSPATPCLASICIGNGMGSWVINNTSSTNKIATNTIVSTLNSLSSDINIAPAIVAVSNISQTSAATPFLSKQASPDNRYKNTLETDININNVAGRKSSIMFNAIDTDNDDIFDEGVALSFYSKTDSCVDENNDGIIDPITECDDPSLITAKPASLILEALEVNPGYNEKPVLIAKGGLKTNLQVVEGTSCDVVLHKNVIAADINTGHLLKCYTNENYNYNSVPDAFTGDWKALNYKPHLFMLSEKINITSGSGNGGDNVTSSIKDTIGDDIYNNAEFLIFETSTTGYGYFHTTLSSLLYVPSNSSIINRSSQIIVPFTKGANIAFTASSASGGWEINLIGYIDID